MLPKLFVRGAFDAKQELLGTHVLSVGTRDALYQLGLRLHPKVKDLLTRLDRLGHLCAQLAQLVFAEGTFLRRAASR